MSFALGEMGMRDDDLWDLTPYELHRRMTGWKRRQEASRMLAIYEAWHAAALSRAKRMPSLEHLLKPGKSRRLKAKEAKAKHRELEEAAERAGVRIYTGARLAHVV